MIEIKGIDPKMIANNIEPFEPTHPGELLRDEIECRHISQKQLAADMGVSYTVLNDIVNCKRPVNTKFALLCEAALCIPAHILMGLQSDYDMQTTKNDKSFAARLRNVHDNGFAGQSLQRFEPVHSRLLFRCKESGFICEENTHP